jgi:twitching motility protein PilJ
LETAETDPGPDVSTDPVDLESAPTQMEAMPEYDDNVWVDEADEVGMESLEDQTLFMTEPPSQDDVIDEFPPDDGIAGFNDVIPNDVDNEGAVGETYDDLSFVDNGAAIAEDSTGSQSNVDFLDDFDEFDDLGSIPDFEMTDSSAGFTSPSVGSSGLGAVDDSSESSFGASDFAIDDSTSTLDNDEIFVFPARLINCRRLPKLMKMRSPRRMLNKVAWRF